MSALKRSKGTSDGDGLDRPSKNRRVRFSQGQGQEETEFEFDHEDALEPAQRRRGAVREDVYSSESEAEAEEDDDDDDKGKNKQDDDDMDMFGEDAGESAAKKKKQQFTELRDIEGQVFHKVLSDDEEDGQEKITPFNMREEMEEGNVDEEGHFIRAKKDPQAFHDQWLAGISNKDMSRAREAQEKKAQREATLEAERQSELPQTKTEAYRQLVEYLQPGEDVREALARYGASARKIPAWKQKLMAKKNKGNKAGAQSTPSAEEEAASRAKVERLTALADQLMALGHFAVYDDTFEIMLRHLRHEGAVDPDWLPSKKDT